jgi:TFIIF-interacting CTD phosphatase-like protein
MKCRHLLRFALLIDSKNFSQRVMIKNIILDIDETLIHTSSKFQPDTAFSFKIEAETYFVSLRPNLRKFLQFCFTNFETVSIWTAATERYAYAIMTRILDKRQQQKLRFFHTRKHLVDYAKPLDLIFTRPDAIKMDIRPYNTVIIDDKIEASKFNLGNTIIVPPWCGGPDTNLFKLIIVLKGIQEHGFFTDSNVNRPLYLKEIA